MQGGSTARIQALRIQVRPLLPSMAPAAWHGDFTDACAMHGEAGGGGQLLARKGWTGCCFWCRPPIPRPHCTPGMFNAAGPQRFWTSFGPPLARAKAGAVDNRHLTCFPFWTSVSCKIWFPGCKRKLTIKRKGEERAKEGAPTHPASSTKPWALCELSDKEGRKWCCKNWLDNPHPIQRLWLMGSPWGLPFPPPLPPLPASASAPSQSECGRGRRQTQSPFPPWPRSSIWGWPRPQGRIHWNVPSKSQVGAANKNSMDSPTACKSQMLYNRLIQAALDSQGSTFYGTSMYDPMIMQYDGPGQRESSTWVSSQEGTKKQPALFCEESVI